MLWRLQQVLLKSLLLKSLFFVWFRSSFVAWRRPPQVSSQVIRERHNRNRRAYAAVVLCSCQLLFRVFLPIRDRSGKPSSETQVVAVGTHPLGDFFCVCRPERIGSSSQKRT